MQPNVNKKTTEVKKMYSKKLKNNQSLKKCIQMNKKEQNYEKRNFFKV